MSNQLPSIHPASELTEFLPVPHGSIPRCAQDLMTICDRVENYPRDLIERIVVNSPEDSSSMDRMKTHGTEASDILLRKNSLNDESDGLQEPPRDMILIKNRLRRSISNFKCGCGFKLSIDSVDMAVNQRGDWRIIAHSNKTNFGLDYFPIHVELCRNPARYVERNSTELVEQLLSLVPLPCLSNDGKSLEIDYFLFPTCCLCKF
ncbi:uncharacterized protein LOC141855012 [Brevipalpus obovatus]|uniref:uncharacterized protein LOC141855012 n=1 Tax=Brevipalpus obovatus TaxID=246614 RepID=UPI003D9EB62B